MEELAQSAANVHAHCFRAQVQLDAKHYEQAKNDIYTAMELQQQSNHCTLPKSAYRILADAEEASGDPIKAIEALRKWAKAEPQFAIKVANEVGRIKSTINSSQQP